MKLEMMPEGNITALAVNVEQWLKKSKLCSDYKSAAKAAIMEYTANKYGYTVYPHRNGEEIDE